MKKPTVLITAPYFWPRIGGLEAYALASAEALVKRGWTVIVAAGAPVKQVEVDEHAGMTIYRLPISRVYSNTPVNLKWPLFLRTIIRQHQPDVINAHTPVPYMVDMTALVARRIPLVITYHAATLQKPASPLLAFVTNLYEGVQRLTLGKARRIIAVSDYVRSSLPGPIQKKTVVVYNATTPQPVNKAGRGFVFMANLSKAHSWKGLDAILDAMATIHQPQDPNFHLTIIGDGDNRAHYEELANRLGLANSVTFTGQLSGEKKTHALASASALIAYPTTANDAFPTVILEAWALGLAVVAAAIGPMPSLVRPGETGVLVHPGRPTELADALRQLVATGNARKLGEAGRASIISTYNWEAQGANLDRILKEVMA